MRDDDRSPPAPDERTARPYEVGYGKPPPEHRFKKGQPSPNPRGRPRRQRGVFTLASFRRIVFKAADEPITVKKDGRSVTMSRTEAMIQVTFTDALKGETKAIRAIFEWLRLFERQGAALDQQDEKEKLKPELDLSRLNAKNGINCWPCSGREEERTRRRNRNIVLPRSQMRGGR